MKNKKGFTLIELMIVVAIIGILAALAIPDFMKMLAKSKQSEAKTNLGAIFTGEVAYHGEHNSYGWGFDQIAWAPEGQNKYTYSLGAAGGTACDRDNMGSTQECSTFEAYDPAIVQTPVCEQMDASSTSGFDSCATSNIDNDGTLDSWSINEDKNLKNDTNDVNL